mgnify:CR=1 FL=1|jgi:small conductance mechanosensitive channel
MGETIEVIQELALLYGVKVISALAIFIVGRWAAKKISKIVQKIMLIRLLSILLAAWFPGHY